MLDNLTAINLIESAMRGVRIVTCPECFGICETLEGPCDACDGAGQTTTNRLESART